WPKSGLSVGGTREHNWLDNCPTDSEQPPVVLPFSIQRIDARRGDVRAALAELRAKLSPAGSVVSEAGRRRTVEVFGEPLTPQQVVERICGDVKQRGLAAVLEYSQKLDRAELTAQTIRVSASELAAAHTAADREY